MVKPPESLICGHGPVDGPGLYSGYVWVKPINPHGLHQTHIQPTPSLDPLSHDATLDETNPNKL